MAILSINGVAVADPSKFQVLISDLDGETNRNAAGTLIRYRIAVKRKLVCEWPALSQANISSLLNAVSAVFFTATYLDPMAGTVTKTFYVGDRTMPVLFQKAGVVTWQGLSMNLVEQ